MLNYFKDEFIESQELLQDGDTEVIFIDKSRFKGQLIDQKITKEGVFYMQDVAKFQGDFFENSFHKGKFSFKDICLLDGKFSTEEIFQQGKLLFFKNQKSFEIYNPFGQIESLKFIGDDEEEIEIGKKSDINKYEFDDNWIILLSNDYTCIEIFKTYDITKYDQKRTIIDLSNKTFCEETYHQGKRVETTYFLSLGKVPYYQEYEQMLSEENLPKFFTNAANGNTYEGTISYDKGMVTISNKNYFFSGGIKGPYKHGYGKIIFEDNCQKDVEYIDDKLAFKSLTDVFNFVADFECLNHDELLQNNNINMIRFMKDIVSFKGFIDQGNTEEKCEIKYRNNDQFSGFIRNFKKSGYGEIIRGNQKIIGDFFNDVLPFGLIDYGNGTQYEGKLIDYERNGKGIMIFQNDNFFSGLFIGDQIHDEGGILNFEEQEYEVFYVHIFEFEIGIFVEKMKKQLFALDCKQNKVYDSKLIDSLKESGIDIRQSLRDMNKI